WQCLLRAYVACVTSLLSGSSWFRFVKDKTTRHISGKCLKLRGDRLSRVPGASVRSSLVRLSAIFKSTIFPDSTLVDN
ncbi:hypothetical protein AMECASPLE_034404, partial [Ameca splendens]